MDTTNIRVIDIETYDPELKERGPGVYNDSGAYVLGIGITNERNKYEYLPIGHRGVTLEQREKAKERARVLCADPCDKLMVNAQYDMDFLENKEGIPVAGFIHDPQIAEPLLDAYALSYELNVLCRKYGVEEKRTSEIERYAENLDPKHKYKPQELLWLMPTQIVADYCEGDIWSPLEVLRYQLHLLEQQELMDLYRLECRLIRPLIRMRKNGVRIDLERRTKAVAEVEQIENAILKDLYGRYGTFNINSSKEIAKFLTADGIKLPKTATGALSVTKEVLEEHVNDSYLCAPLKRVRALNKLRTTFLTKSIDEHICEDGKMHGQFVQLKRDEGGTITGRFSGRNPNLQQIPRNDEELGALVRGLFIPLDNHWYGKTDYSQIEYRLFLHFASGWRKGDEFDLQAEAVRQKFITDPTTDYHQFVIDTIKEMTGIIIDRATAKRVNFGTLYFMGAKALSRKFHMPYDEAVSVQNALFDACPFIESTRQNVVDTAIRRGYVRTLLKRRQRLGQHHIDEGREYALFNYELQGSAADIMKKAMDDCEQAGIYDVLHLELTVHDELGTSVPKTKEGIEAYEEQAQLMENAIKLSLPVKVEADFGPNWGEKIKVPKEKSTFDYMRSLL
jgi:DNA polymerase I-like protein with 3'-5' exonuclease and polymerase domains